MRQFKFFEKPIFQIFPNRFYTGERGKLMSLPMPVTSLYYSINEPLTIHNAIHEVVTIHEINIRSMASFLNEYNNAYIWLYGWKMRGYENFMKYDSMNVPMNEPLTIRCVIR